MIEIISPTRIEVDGKDAGLPLDYFLANVDKRNEVKAAFIAWHASHVIAQQARDADVVAAKADLEAEKAALRADKDTLIAAHAADKAALLADLEVLGTKEEAQAIRKANDIAKARAEADAAMNKLASLIGEELEPMDAKP